VAALVAETKERLRVRALALELELELELIQTQTGVSAYAFEPAYFLCLLTFFVNEEYN
jgi:hypothetical protein